MRCAWLSYNQLARGLLSDPRSQNYDLIGKKQINIWKARKQIKYVQWPENLFICVVYQAKTSLSPKSLYLCQHHQNPFICVAYQAVAGSISTDRQTMRLAELDRLFNDLEFDRSLPPPGGDGSFQGGNGGGGDASGSGGGSGGGPSGGGTGPGSGGG